jgi:hypothetical protein
MGEYKKAPLRKFVTTDEKDTEEGRQPLHAGAHVCANNHCDDEPLAEPPLAPASHLQAATGVDSATPWCKS